ncbi:MAG: BREX system Lon protease-like protein BrxL [Candidatus Marinimicrobia bacterium]|jgi:ATP-dependent Lon protease|nr:BREX system Lon protease-like protein BrxL [Candidatus Neomarinimicrobiota bacterium]MBT4000428.1 BREX system Lon protease-like protein BrxL [Candidatus Neomarinimicrobiota bacterium]MBT4283211.1 BREX system Lon protease-like protein BrxL [Candidatus Neomarinimicrobiota bacterium]MBT4579602.1 BREX system Lon protease-like protein BrxL [Candidatus Neomarinimicrobiota bacterium]MBT4958210.1 BREX system Lon protease-like protein BrxL [Candidatus Neomarinimicrobiota bacterium]
MKLQDKILEHFDGKVVRKDLTKGIKGNAVVPTYVLEYLLGQHCATFDEDIIAQGLDKVKNIIRDHFVHRDEAEEIKYVIKEKNQHKVIDKVSVRLNESKDRYECTFTNLGLKNVPIATSIVKKHKKLLSGGVWCIITIGYLYDEGEDMPWLLQDVKPIQISNIDMDDILKLREEFTKEEWVDFLIQSIGLEPSEFNFRSKLIQLTRLIPHCENNYNFIELGPKGTGKSHIFSELSPHGILISGGEVTQAKLFINNSNNQIGLVGYWDVVAFDEFAGSQKTSDKKLVDIMKNYMANKSFSRGKDVFGATASFAFVGNTEHSVPYMLKNTNLFDALPKAYYDSAFLDRIHMYLPGWEVAKLRNEMFTSGYGLIVDFLAEMLKQLRKDDYSSKMNGLVELDSSLTTRDRDGITKTFSGLMKIIYPHGKFTHDEAIELVNYSLEGRKRVKDQLIKMDDTFEEVVFGYMDKQSGKNETVDTLENIEFGGKLAPVEDSIPEVEKPQSENPSSSLKGGQVVIRENQVDISYDKLFSSYLSGAKHIQIEDPYIRLPYQMNLLLEFCSMLIQNKSVEDEITLNLVTWNEPDVMLQESTDSLTEIATSLFDSGIHLTFEFNPNIHDRFIKSDTGWKIVLGRGLDIFQRPEGRFNIAGFQQEQRQCKSCEITFVEIK